MRREEEVIEGENMEVCPREDVVRAFIEYLVDPSLPFRVSDCNPPDLSVQQAVAEQMQGVVLLYNYFYQKQRPEVEFMNCFSFWKLSVTLNKRMRAFMKVANQAETVELIDIKDGLSITEKAISAACDISYFLDPLKDVPNIKGWPISKVAVLLLDAKTENFYLQYGSVTQGVWSPIEKEIDESDINNDTPAGGETIGRKRKRNSRTLSAENISDDNGYLLLAFGAVKEATSIDSSNVVVLETHNVYSLSKEKTAVRLYIMQCVCNKLISGDILTPVEDVMNSLQVPVVEKTLGSWTKTPFIEYYHIYPYLGIISHWYLRTHSLPASLGSSNGERIKEVNNDLNFINNMSSHTTDNSCATENGDSSKKKCKHSYFAKEASPVNISPKKAKEYKDKTKDNKTREKKKVHRVNPQPQYMGALQKTSPSSEDKNNNQISETEVHQKKKNSLPTEIDAQAPVGAVDLELMKHPSLHETMNALQPNIATAEPSADEVENYVAAANVCEYVKQRDAPVKEVEMYKTVPSCSSGIPAAAGQVPFEGSDYLDQHLPEAGEQLTATNQLPLEKSNSVDQKFSQEVRDRLTAVEHLPPEASNSADKPSQAVEDWLTAMERHLAILHSKLVSLGQSFVDSMHGFSKNLNNAGQHLSIEISNCVDKQLHPVKDRLVAMEPCLGVLDAKLTSLGLSLTDSVDGFSKNLKNAELKSQEEFQHFDVKFKSLSDRVTGTIVGFQQNLDQIELCCKKKFQDFDTKFDTVIGMLQSLIQVQQYSELKQTVQSELGAGLKREEKFKQTGNTGLQQPCPTISPKNLLDSFNNEVEPEVMLYKEKDGLVKKKPKILRSSSTSPQRPCKQRALDTFNILCEVDPDKELSFESWYQTAKDSDRVDFDILVANKLWFSTLIKDGGWVEGEHVDVAMHFIRLRIQSYPRMFLPHYAILDSTFGQCIYELWHEGNHRFKPKRIRYPDSIQWYVNGEWPSHGMSWSECEHMLIPFNVGQSHWVALYINLLAWELTVYDGDIACYTDAVMEEKVTCFLTLIPLIFESTGIFGQRGWRHQGPLKFVRKKKTEIPQTKKSGDCGIYTVKYIECLVADLSVDMVRDENMMFWRRKLAAEIYSKKFDP